MRGSSRAANTLRTEKAVKGRFPPMNRKTLRSDAKCKNKCPDYGLPLKCVILSYFISYWRWGMLSGEVGRHGQLKSMPTWLLLEIQSSLYAECPLLPLSGYNINTTVLTFILKGSIFLEFLKFLELWVFASGCVYLFVQYNQVIKDFFFPLYFSND
jgi:hypothetical protein